MTVAILYARKNSIYKSLPGVSVFDENRDARTFSNDMPVVAHPPCRLFGKLKHFSKAPAAEKQLAYDAVQRVKLCGGVLEHPAFSTLFEEMTLPLPGVSIGNSFTFPILQSWFGHKAPKATWLYINGITPSQLPPFPLQLGVPSGRISNTGSMKVREGTPIQLAEWLILVANLCDKTNLRRVA
jgi:hypothetical protein